MEEETKKKNAKVDGKTGDIPVLEEVLVSEICAKIRNGELIDRVIINDDLDIIKLDLQRETDKFLRSSEIENYEYKIVFPIRITNSIIKGRINFDDIVFEKPINFENTQFKDNVSFERAVFEGKASFYKASFRRNAHFEKANFKGKAVFEESKFAGLADFTEAIFGSTPESGASFSKAIFCKNANYEKAKFEMGADFARSTFKGTADFSGTIFGWTGKFISANFILALFKEYVFFNRATFDGIADFSAVIFERDAIFQESDFKMSLNLIRTNYENLYIRWENFTKPRYSLKFLEHWRRINNLKFDDFPYIKLIENLKRLGLFGDADNLYYDYRVKSRKYLPILNQPIDLMLRVFYGYGVRPIRPLIWSVIFFLAFGLLYAIAPDVVDITKANSTIDAFNSSLTILMSGTKLIETPNYPVSGFLPYWIYTFEKFLGTLFLGMFLVSVGKTIIRDP